MLKYKTFWRRFVAGFIDGLVFMPLSLVGMWCTQNAASIPPVAFAAIHVITTFMYYAYTIIMHGKFGQTLGKMAMKVRVIDVSETRPISYRQSFLRDIVPVSITAVLIPHDLMQLLNGTSYMLNPGTMPDTISIALGFVMMGWGLLEVTTMLMNSKRRAIHDFIAGSVVVKTDFGDLFSGGIHQTHPTMPAPKNSVATGCLIAVAGLVVILAVGGYLAYTKVADTLKKAGIEKPIILIHPGIAVGKGRFDKSTFVADSRLGLVTDMKWGHFMDDQDRLLVAASSRGAVFFRENGSFVRHIPFTNRAGDVRTITPGHDRDFVFVNKGAWGMSASLIGQDGATIWEYGGSPGVNAMRGGDMDGDGKLEFVVGFNGAGGIHLLDEQGNKRWEKSGGNIWNTEIVDATGEGDMRIVHSDAGGRLTVRDGSGNTIKTTNPKFYFSHFSISPWPTPDGRPHGVAAENDVIWLLDVNGNVAAQFDAPDCGNLGHAYGTPFAMPSGEEFGFAVIVNYPNWKRSMLYLYDDSKTLLYQEVLAEPGSAITTRRNASTGGDFILVGGSNRIHAYVPAH